MAGLTQTTEDLIRGENIISREAAEKGLADLLDFFARYSKIRKSVTVVGSECPAAELLTVDSESGLLPAERINKIMSYGTDTSNYDGSKLIDSYH